MTEIDVVWIDATGIDVFESKTYSGWIQGDTKRKNWTQTFKNKKKYQFFNPIKQNKAHIRYLSAVLAEVDQAHFYSCIVFSDRSRLKQLSPDGDVRVTQLHRFRSNLDKRKKDRPMVLSFQEREQIFHKHKSFTLVSDEIKRKHISDVNHGLS